MTEHHSTRDLDRAYATLGVPFGTSRQGIVRQYRHLVRRWHPDRFANDPERHAEATRRMQVINSAFEAVMDTIIGDLDSPVSRQATKTSAHASSPIQDIGRRLTPEEIEEISKAIGEPGIVAFVGRSLWWMSAIAAAVLLLGFGGRLGGRTPRPIEVIVAVLILCLAGVSVLRRLRTGHRE